MEQPKVDTTLALSQELIEAVERGESIKITREGKEIAVILSAAEYQHLSDRKRGFSSALRDFRAEMMAEGIEIDPDEIFAGVRDRAACA